ncbi:MAG: hypothetical protein KIS74_17685 [Burkholderiales bacterium]|nr:hypothetical protein [Burkholderiales bacterium]
MPDQGLFASIPLWILFLATLGMVLASVETGYRWAGKRQRRDREEKEFEAPVGAMVGATLGLLAFLLAFTFGMAADHFQARKHAVLNEANAIRVTHALAGALAEAPKAEVRAILHQYAQERLRWAETGQAESRRAAAAMLERLWAQSNAVAAQNPGAVDAFLGAVARLTELHEERVMVRDRGRIPAGIWAILFLVAVLSLGAMGYHGGVAGTTRSPVMLAVALTFSLVIMLIADIDRPGQGWINVSQEAMVDVRDAIAPRAGR